MGKLDGRVVIVTGAARGQGEQEARLFAAEGAKVVVADVLDEQGEALAKELGASASYVHLDVGEEAEWGAAVRAAKEAYGRIDGLVNNAGILRFNSLVDTPLEEFMQVVRVNQVGCFLGIKTVAAAMEDGGTIVNTASYTAVTGMAAVGTYAATKHAILGLTRVAALELADRRIRVNAMCPGAIDTAMSNPAQLDPNADVEAMSSALDELYRKLVPLGRIGKPAEVARLALFLTSDDSSYITGQPFVIDGGWLAGVSVI
ncbi:glucose 1-dehydrogenase [Streptomyces sp. N50]|uniref:SDR family NAD(P)-dependent oxidoreductase n=1 Tax=Streptomyces sp. N50 TaxID=3081765 RepID=UPI0029620B08|nr:glucose 1-dehydrogenase [Streptomyces sp. N50]WOX10384.1 glucose 1-dehydrogenase [Streptomyces sp. N50]